MIKKVFPLIVVMAATAAYGQQSDQGSSSSRGNYDPNQVICQRIGETGSRLARRRVCMTRAEWARMRAENRQDVDRAQNNRPSSAE